MERFSSVSFLNKSGIDVDFALDNKAVERPSRSPDGRQILWLDEPDGDERHTALGRFMDSWSELEQTVSVILSDVLDIPRTAVSVLMNTLGTHGQLNVITKLGIPKTPEKFREDLANLVDRLRKYNTKRNNVAHGAWTLLAIARRKGTEAHLHITQLRLYEPSDPAVMDRIWSPAGRSDRDRYVFSIARLDALSREIRRLRDDFRTFRKKRDGLPLDAIQFRLTNRSPDQM